METSTHRPYALSIPRTLCLLLHYFLGYGFFYPRIAIYLTLRSNPHATMIPPILQWMVYILCVVITALLAWPALKHSFLRLKERLKSNIALIIGMSVLLIVVNVSLSILVSIFTKTDGSNNQELIREAKNAIPLITVIASCIVAPFVEECVFRSGAYALLRRKAGFIISAIISSLLFASIHFINSARTGDFSDFSYIIVYFGLGMVLSYSFEKSDSVAVSFSVHFINNALSMLTMFL